MRVSRPCGYDGGLCSFPSRPCDMPMRHRTGHKALPCRALSDWPRSQGVWGHVPARSRGGLENTGAACSPEREQRHPCPGGHTDALTEGKQMWRAQGLTAALCVRRGNVNGRVGSFKNSLVFPTILYKSKGKMQYQNSCESWGLGRLGGKGEGAKKDKVVVSKQSQGCHVQHREYGQ